MKEKAKMFLLELKIAPRMFATSKEALIMRVTTILEMTLDDFDAHAFYNKHLEKKGTTYINLNDLFDKNWADAIIDDAITYL